MPSKQYAPSSGFVVCRLLAHRIFVATAVLLSSFTKLENPVVARCKMPVSIPVISRESLDALSLCLARATKDQTNGTLSVQ